MIPIPSTTEKFDDVVSEQLALPTSDRVTVQTKHGKVTGGRVKNGVQVFLNVPYAEPVPRWTDAQTLDADFKYEDKEYTVDGLYVAQPRREYNMNPDKKPTYGLGAPTDTPFFADIFVPSTYNLSEKKELLPVKVFLHGGFLQFGCTSGFHYNQQQYACEISNEIRVMLGHRVSVLGFLASASPKVSGNFGFKDVWCGLEWVQNNIESWGGDKNNVDLSGLSGGAHLACQLLHKAAREAPAPAPFKTVFLQSNAVLTNPVSQKVAQPQFDALATSLGLSLDDPNLLETMRDPSKVSSDALMHAVEGDLMRSKLATFRGVIDDDGWLKEIVEFQRSGGLAKGLREAGVTCVTMGDVRDEREFYKVVHPAKTFDELVPNLTRYYPAEAAKALVAAYEVPTDLSPKEIDYTFGRILADGQVHLPVRLLAKDLLAAEFPVVRYEVRYQAEFWSKKSKFVEHGFDLMIHHIRLSTLNPTEVLMAQTFLKKLEEERLEAEAGKSHPWDEVLTLDEEGVVSWKKDARWPELVKAEKAVRD